MAEWRPLEVPDPNGKTAAQKKGFTKKDREEIWEKAQNFLKQPSRRDGDFIVVTEKYFPPESGFPGRLYSHDGCQGMWRPIRNHMLAGTSDLDMSICMQRCVLWECMCAGIDAPCLHEYILYREEKLADFMQSEGCTRDVAKEMFQIPLTWNQHVMGVTNAFFRLFDQEMKRVQRELVATPEHQWILPFRKEENREGSFISLLYQHRESTLVLAVIDALTAKYGEDFVCLLIHDGINIHDPDGELFGDQSVLNLAHATCEQVCPGINMIWAWKKPDFMIRSHGTKQPLKELTIPESFPPIHGNEGIIRKGWMTFDHLADYMDTMWRKAGHMFIKNKEDGTLGLCKKAEVKDTYEHYKYFTTNYESWGGGWPDPTGLLWRKAKNGMPSSGQALTNEALAAALATKTKFEQAEWDAFGVTVLRMDHFVKSGTSYFQPVPEGPVQKKVQKDADSEEEEDKPRQKTKDKTTSEFITPWFTSARLTVFEDGAGSYPDPSKCPKGVFNTWTPYRFEALERNGPFTLDIEGVRFFLKDYQWPYLNRDRATFDFSMKWHANIVQYPAAKSVAPNFVTPEEGVGKGCQVDGLRCWLGAHKVLETDDPNKWVFGEFNGRMLDAKIVALDEVHAADLNGRGGKLLHLITAPKQHINEKGVKGFEIEAPHVVMGMTNQPGAWACINKPGSRRTFDILCSNELKGRKDLWDHIYYNLYPSEAFARSMGCLLTWWPTVPKLTGEVDIPVLAYDQEMKQYNLSVHHQFLKDIVRGDLDRAGWQTDKEITEKITSERMWQLFKWYCDRYNYPVYASRTKFDRAISPKVLRLPSYKTHGWRDETQWRGADNRHPKVHGVKYDPIQLGKYFGLLTSDGKRASACGGEDREDETQMDDREVDAQIDDREGTFIDAMMAEFKAAMKPQWKAKGWKWVEPAGGGFERTGDLSNKSNAFQRIVHERLNEWKVRLRAANRFMDTIPAEQTEKEKEKIVKALESEWKAKGWPWVSTDGDAQEAHPGSPANEQATAMDVEQQGGSGGNGGTGGSSGGSSSGRVVEAVPEVDSDDDVESRPRLSDTARQREGDSLRRLQPPRAVEDVEANGEKGGEGGNGGEGDNGAEMPSTFVVFVRGKGRKAEALLTKERLGDGSNKLALLGRPMDPNEADPNQAVAFAAQQATGQKLSKETQKAIGEGQNLTHATHPQSKDRVVVHEIAPRNSPDCRLKAPNLQWVPVKNLRDPKWRKNEMHADACARAACVYHELTTILKREDDGWDEEEDGEEEDGEEAEVNNDSDRDEAAEAVAIEKKLWGDEYRDDNGQSESVGDGEEDEEEEDEDDADSNGSLDSFIVNDDEESDGEEDESEDEGEGEGRRKRHRGEARRRERCKGEKRRKRVISDTDDEKDENDDEQRRALEGHSSDDGDGFVVRGLRVAVPIQKKQGGVLSAQENLEGVQIRGDG